jgi:catalase
MTNTRMFFLTGLVAASTHVELPAQSSHIDISHEIAEVMSQGPSGKAHQRFVHAKGMVCTGAFEPSPGAVAISRAAHFASGSVPVTARFSDGAPDISVPDNSSDASPRGMALRFGAGRGTDIMAISHN